MQNLNKIVQEVRKTGAGGPGSSIRPFTQDSFKKIQQRIADEKAKQLQELKDNDAAAAVLAGEGTKKPSTAAAAAAAKRTAAAAKKKAEVKKLKPSSALEQAKKFPDKLGDFPPELFGRPIEDLDEFYANRYTFMVVAKDLTIFRFSASKALFLFDAMNPVRRAAIYTLTHPFFSLLVMIVILINCVFMAINQDLSYTEEVFTAIYTLESTTRMLARGLILTDFTYLRDPWNWLDFTVVFLAYITMAFPDEMGNLAALRAFRVVRALKTVAIVPGLKVIVGALMEAVRRLRDVFILTGFLLSIFALIGLQIYQGSLLSKCVRDMDSDPDAYTRGGNETHPNKITIESYEANEDNWYAISPGKFLVCSYEGGGGKCPVGYTCKKDVGINPNYGYTNFDNFGYAILCAFRLMTQDYWENLYQLVLRANGPYHMMFFILVIFLGSFYLVNLILAIVAMSYDDCQKREKQERDELIAEAMEHEAQEIALLEEMMKRASPSLLSGELIEQIQGGGGGGSGSRRSTMDSKTFGDNLNRTRSGSGSPFARRRSPHSSPFADRRTTWTNHTLRQPSGSDRHSHQSVVPLKSLDGTHPQTAEQLYHMMQATKSRSSRRSRGSSSRSYASRMSEMESRLSSTRRTTTHSQSSFAPSLTPRGSFIGQPPLTPRPPSTPRGSLGPSSPLPWPSSAALGRNAPTTGSFASPTLALPPNALGFTSPAHPVTSLHSDSATTSITSSPVHFHYSFTSPQSSVHASPKHSDVIRRNVVAMHSPETTHFRWNGSVFSRQSAQLPDVIIDNTKALGDEECVSISDTQSIKDQDHLAPFNLSSFKSGRLSNASVVDMNDVMAMRDLLSRASGGPGLVDDMELTWQDWLRIKVEDILFGWDCYPRWYDFAHVIELFIMDAFVDLIITLCIVVNTIFMAMEHADMTSEMTNFLRVGNYAFTTIFATEAFLKILALGLYQYLRDKWSCFDIVIVLLSLIELGLEGVKGLSILRSFRLLRVFKLAKSWPTLNLLIGIIGRTMGALGNLCFVLAIIIFIFAVMGMQLFGSNYSLKNFGEEIPRWNFTDFLHSFMIVFRVLCGEWIESMWDCIKCSGPICVPFFLLTMIIGNLVVLNLFLALLLSSFGAESLAAHTAEQEESPDVNKLQEAAERIQRLMAYFRSHSRLCAQESCCCCCCCGGGCCDSCCGGGSCSCCRTSNRERKRRKSAVKAAVVRGTVKSAEQNTTSKANVNQNHIKFAEKTGKSHAAKTFSSPEFEDDDDLGFLNTQSTDQLMLKALPNTDARLTNNKLLLDEMKDRAKSIRTPVKKDPHQMKAAFLLQQTKPETSQFHSAAQRFNTSIQPPSGSFHPAQPSHLPPINTQPHSSSSDVGRSRQPHVAPSSTDENEKCTGFTAVACLIDIDDESNANVSLFNDDYNEYDGAEDDNEEEEEELLNGEQGGEGGPDVKDGGEGGGKMRDVTVIYVKYPEDFCPKSCRWKYRCWESFLRTSVGRRWWSLRCYMNVLVDHTYFETFIIVMILASSVALACEDVHIDQRPVLKHFLKSCDKIFTMIFVLEMMFKMIAYGLKRYFTDAWCWLDFIIVAISIVSLAAESMGYGNVSAFRALRTLRALRPLRAVSRWEGMKLVVNALIQAIPSILNVLLVCLVFWLIFGIMGVNLFGGRFRRCLDDGENVVDISKIATKDDCLANNYTWDNPKINFDHVPAAYLALFQVATFKGWMDIIRSATDSKPDADLQPEREWRAYMYLYFVFFIVFGSFFTLNLFIGVIIDNFNMQKRKISLKLEMLLFLRVTGIEMFMTDDQKRYYNAMKKLGSKQPQKPIPKPRFEFQLFFFDLVNNQSFDAGIMVVIVLNMIQMALEYHGQPQSEKDLLTWVNIFFISVFTLECCFKLAALRLHYFKQPWNVFDFIVVCFSIIVSLPALFNIGMLLFLIMFIFSVFGMQFFMHVRKSAGIDDMFNFETFGQGMIVLFQTATSAGWDGVLAGLMIEPDKCDPTPSEIRPNGDCGSRVEAIVFLVSFLIISFLVIINMYIAVILENFSQATEDVQQGLTQDDFDMYYEVWERFDETATQFISFYRLGEFMDALEGPLRLPAPNYFKIVSLNIPLYESDMVHCVDILDALTKNFLGTTRDEAGALGDLKKGPETKLFKICGTTMDRQREEYCARMIQLVWKKHVQDRRAARERDGLPPGGEQGSQPPGGDTVSEGGGEPGSFAAAVAALECIPEIASLNSDKSKSSMSSLQERLKQCQDLLDVEISTISQTK